MNDLEDLLTLCADKGSQLQLIQGAGGNVSIKHQGVLWIKASGQRLDQALSQPILTQVDLNQAQHRAQLGLETFQQALLGDPLLRPSIETGFHALLPDRIVFHWHSTALLSWSVDGLLEQAVQRVPGAVGIPYKKPGSPLALAMLAAKPASIYLLDHHGVVVAGPDVPSIQTLIDQVESRLARPSRPLPAFLPPQRGWEYPTYPAIQALCGPHGTWLLDQPALFPDQAVFLGVGPYSNVRIDPEIGVWVLPTMSRDAEMMLAALGLIAQCCQHPVSSLSQHDALSLVDWDLEIYRRSLMPASPAPLIRSS